MMSSLYFVSFFCGYPTNVKIIKEAYELNYIDLDELQHLLSIASFSSISFIFVSLNTPYSLLIFICHLLPSLILALFYHHPQKKLTFKQVRQTLKQPHLSFVKAFKKKCSFQCLCFPLYFRIYVDFPIFCFFFTRCFSSIFF